MAAEAAIVGGGCAAARRRGCRRPTARATDTMRSRRRRVPGHLAEAFPPDDTWSHGRPSEIVDCRLAKPAESNQSAAPAVWLRGRNGLGLEVKLTGGEPGQYHRYAIRVKGREVAVSLDGKESQRSTLPETVPARGAFGLSNAGGEAQFMNLYARDLALTTP